jgi:hypothetical protein
MADISTLLTPIRVGLADLLLDPNNPRFHDLEGQFGKTPEARFNEPGVQRATFERLKDRRFDVSSLRDTIKTIGFLSIDKIVVRRCRLPAGQPEKYLVLEGNRRVAALKWLIDLNDAGQEQLSEAQIQNFSDLEVLLLSEDANPNIGQWIIPGLRHVSGIKEWGAYQQAVAVKTLRESGLSPQEAAQSIGLSTKAANKLWRTFWALDQMRHDEEFEDSSKESLFSYFDELLKRPNLKDWFGWDDNERKFTNIERIREFYSWIVGAPEGEGEEERQQPKIGRAIDVRDLAMIVDEPLALGVLRGPNSNLEDALATFKSIHPEDWRSYVATTESLLTRLSPDSLRRLNEDDLRTLESLSNRVRQVIEDRRRLV